MSEQNRYAAALMQGKSWLQTSWGKKNIHGVTDMFERFAEEQAAEQKAAEQEAKDERTLDDILNDVRRRVDVGTLAAMVNTESVDYDKRVKLLDEQEKALKAELIVVERLRAKLMKMADTN